MKVIFLGIVYCAFPLALALTSICPGILQYKTTQQSALEYQSWSAVLHLQQIYNSYGRNVDLLLDRTASHFSAHHFDVVTSDSKKFHLSSRNQSNSSPTHSEQNRIYVTVEFEGQIVPLVDEIRVNGVRICPLVTTSTSRTTRRTTESYLRPQPTTQLNSREIYYDRTTERSVFTSSSSSGNNFNTNNNNNRRVTGDAAYNPLGSDRGRSIDNVNDRDLNSRETPTTNSNNKHHHQSGASGSNAPRQDDNWNSNGRRITQQTPPPTTTKTTTSSPYFAGDLHLIFQSNGNERVINH